MLRLYEYLILFYMKKINNFINFFINIFFFKVPFVKTKRIFCQNKSFLLSKKSLLPSILIGFTQIKKNE